MQLDWQVVRSIATDIASCETASPPTQIVMAEGQITITPSGDLEDGIGNGGLKRDTAVVSHAVEPMIGLKEADVDLGWIIADAAQGKSIEIVFDDSTLANVTLLIQHVIVEKWDLAFDLFSHGERVDQTEAFVMRNIDAKEAYFAFSAERDGMDLGAERRMFAGLGSAFFEGNGTRRAFR